MRLFQLHRLYHLRGLADGRHRCCAGVASPLRFVGVARRAACVGYDGDIMAERPSPTHDAHGRWVFRSGTPTLCFRSKSKFWNCIFAVSQLRIYVHGRCTAGQVREMDVFNPCRQKRFRSVAELLRAEQTSRACPTVVMGAVLVSHKEF